MTDDLGPTRMQHGFTKTLGKEHETARSRELVDDHSGKRRIHQLRGSRGGRYRTHDTFEIARGGDFETGLRYTGAVLDKAADLLDLYTGHPYASPRYFGPGNNLKWPIQNRMAEKCVEALELFESHGRPRRMWK